MVVRLSAHLSSLFSPKAPFLEIRWLQDFLTLAETGNFTRAATLRHSSQAAFSRRIQQLEAYVGAPLIDRGVFPTKLTPEGELFRAAAGEMLRQVADVRTEIAGRPARSAEHVRIALPYALATSHLPAWWEEWTRMRSVTAELTLGNVHDLGTALMSGAADVVVCFESALQPLSFEAEDIEALAIGQDIMRPFASAALLKSRRFSWPGTDGQPVPLLLYSPGVYFARLVDLTIKAVSTPLPSVRVLVSDMADVLRDMAVRGVGVAWLPEATVAAASAPLEALSGDEWSIPLAIKAFRLRQNTNRASWRLWESLEQSQDGQRR